MQLANVPREMPAGNDFPGGGMETAAAPLSI